MPTSNNETKVKRGPGRPRKYPKVETPFEEVKNTAEVEKEAESVQTPKRPKRTNIGSRRSILSVEAPPGFVGRWVVDNDQGFKIMQLMDLGYSFLEDKYLEVGEVVLANNRQSTSIISRQVNRTGEIAYLMVIPKDLYDEYQAEKQELVDESERAMGGNLKVESKSGVTYTD